MDTKKCPKFWFVILGILLLSAFIINGDEQEITETEELFPGMRAVYIRPEPLNKESIAEYMRNIRSWGAREVFIEAAYHNRALNHSEIFPVRDKEIDWFEKLVREAKKNDLDVHAWIKVCYWVHTEEAMKDFDLLMNNPEWIDLNRKGEYLSDSGTYEEQHFIYVNPAVPGVRQAIHSYVEELMQYDIDGISIDYIRFKACRPDPQYWYGFNEYSMAQFKEETGINPLEIETDIHPDSDFMQWVSYNERVLAEMVGGIASIIGRINEQMGKDVILSASPFTGYQSGHDSKMQNWQLWDDEGYIDLWLPMCMSVNMGALKQEILEVKEMGLQAPYYPVIYPGQHGVLHPPMKPHYEVIQETGIDFFAVFSYKQLLEELGDDQPLDKAIQEEHEEVEDPKQKEEESGMSENNSE